MMIVVFYCLILATQAFNGVSDGSQKIDILVKE
jgi:hypothetical protein